MLRHRNLCGGACKNFKADIGTGYKIGVPGIKCGVVIPADTNWFHGDTLNSTRKVQKP